MRFKRISSAVLVAALGTFTLAACSDDSDNGTTGPTSPPAVPGNVSATVNGSSATVSWGSVSTASQYTVSVSSPNDQRSRTVDHPNTSATIDGLNRGATYAATVSASNSAGSSGASSPATFEVPTEEPDQVVISNDITFDRTLTADKDWILDGPIFVGGDCGQSGDCEEAVTLTIEPGTTIYGRKNPSTSVRGSYLVVSRGSRIIADANPDDSGCTKPSAEDVIVFTSDQPPGERARGDWGGLVINGQAPINSGEEASGEGDSGLYGGTEADDDSGILCGVRVEYAGDDVTTTDQLNGIAYQGVGAGTTVEYVQVHYNVDDGTEPFGGTVTQTHMVMTGIGDDSYDGTDGYQGFMQFLIAQQRGDNADQGAEISNSGSNPDASPHSTAVIANATLVGSGVQLGAGEISGSSIGGQASDAGVLLREGTNYRVFNSIVTGFGASGMDVEGATAAQNADNRLAGQTDPASTLRFEGNILWSNVQQGGGDHNLADESGNGYDRFENLAFFNEDGFRNILADPMLPDDAFAVGSMDSPPNLIPSGTPDGYSAVSVSGITEGLVMPTDGRTLEDTDYAGAVAPGTSVSDAWYSGWTVWTVGGSDSRPAPGSN